MPVALTNLAKYRESNTLEVKKAEKGLPASLWETYSAFANTNGGLILLGVSEDAKGNLVIEGLKKPEAMLQDFWNTLNNQNKISLNILQTRHALIEEVEGKKIIAIEVPRAERQDKPVYINDDLRQSFRRNHAGDYRCTMPAIKAMLRDAANGTQDMMVMDKMDLKVFDYETVKKYRNVFNINHIRHVWSDYNDETFLLKLGALGRSEESRKLCPTGAGLVMFGYEHEILREYPQYFLDYQEHFDESIRWTDRFISSSGEWSGNIYDFYGMAYNKLILNPCFKTPFKMEGIYRVDDTPVRKALREALANCLINADYYGEGGVVIKSYKDKITIENPGILRLTVEEAVSGGFSTPRNGVLMKLFNLIDVGERSGSGIPKVWKAWQDEGWGTPEITERLESLERTTLILPVKSADNGDGVPTKSTDNDEIPTKSTDNGDGVPIKSTGNDKIPTKSTDNDEIPTKSTDNGDGVPIKSADNGGRAPIKTDTQKSIIAEFIKENTEIKSSDLLQVLNVKEERIKKLLQQMVAEGKIAVLGAKKNRTYKLKE
ncbi:MAG: putative DNA binding domain-containing protein [Treponema sp.]|jgi:predicted HTH transcriptional regulator|nr:putative DNA binding domain-containing protein [Treponema sp.]